MAENPTSDSTSTTATDPSPAAAPAAEQTPQPSSTTEQPSSSDESTGTLLTGGTPAVDPSPEAAAGETQPTPEEEARAALFGAPEGQYQLEGLPEGTVIDTETLAAVEPVARELGLSNQGLSKLASVYAEKVVPAVTNQILAQSAQTTKQWATDAIETVKTDPAFGGQPLAQVQATAAKALDRFGGPEFREYLEDTGLGNHPAMLKAMYLAGSAIAEDTTFERGGQPPKVKTREEKFYGSP